VVMLEQGVASSRRIHLRTDDESIKDVALLRELGHTVLADLFAAKPLPKWAEIGMAVLNTSNAEVGRYLRTARRCAGEGQLISAETLMQAKDVPARSVTGFHVASVALVDSLVRLKGEKAFTAFVRDAQRYGYETALKRGYDITGPRQLDDRLRQEFTATAATR